MHHALAELLACMQQFGNVSTTEEGTTGQARIGGHQGSTFRAEILGSILGIAAPKPTHIGIDNSACLATMLQLQYLAAHIPVTHTA